MGKRYILELAETVKNKVNEITGHDVVSLVRRAMMHAGLSKDLGGTWRVEQLSSKLQELLEKYTENFAGEYLQVPQ